MKKQLIRLTESDLNRMIGFAVRRTLNEMKNAYMAKETQQQVENVNENRFSPEAVHKAVTEAIKKVFNQKAETL